MAVARAVYGDLVVLNFTIGAASHPTSTQVPKVITGLYKDAYRVGGSGAYAAYDAGDEHPIIDTEECKQIIIQEAEEIVQAWHDAHPQQPPPSSRMSDDGEDKIKALLKISPNRLTNTRVYGEEWDDL